MAVDVVTFGCRLNAFESEVIRTQAGAAGLDAVTVVNTCAVTAEAVRQARQTIRKLRREQPGRRIVVTGCAAQIDPARFAAMPEVDSVLGNAEKLTDAGWADARRALDGIGGDAGKVAVADIMAVREARAQPSAIAEGRVRAFVPVQNGCDHRCTFCIIPYGRGNSRSVPMGEVVRQVRALVEAGVREIVLTGVDLTSYGGDLPGTPRLGTLVRQLLKHVPDLPRLRLSSIDSIEVDADLLDAIADEPRLMPHFHLSLQAGDDLVLKRMKRRHGRDDAIAFCTQVRRLRPDVVFGADLIAGFPTETDDMFARSLDLVDECGLSLLHVFPFSPREGTPAARMPQVPREVAKARARRLRAKGQAALAQRLAAEIGAERAVLVEADGAGRTEHYLPVTLQTPAEAGALVRCRIVDHQGAALIAA